MQLHVQDSPLCHQDLMDTIPESAGLHRFPDLPLELRERIWTLCLPNLRACELEVCSSEAAFDPRAFTDPSPCHLWHTTRVNCLPPLITRVSQEARKVAYRDSQVTAFWQVGQPTQPQAFYVPRMNRTFWHGRDPDCVHINWIPSLNITNMDRASDEPLDGLVGRVTQSSHRASIFSTFWDLGPQYTTPNPFAETFEAAVLTDRAQTPLTPQTARELSALKKISKWLVVMRIIVVHCNAHTAGRTGSFGRGADARVRIVDAAEQDLIKTMVRLAEQCEKNLAEIKVPQDFTSDG